MFVPSTPGFLLKKILTSLRIKEDSTMHISERLQLLAPVISQICNISAVPGASVGVMHRGDIVYKAGFGQYDLESSLAPDENTIYHIASLTKGFSAAAIMMIADQGKIALDAPLTSVIPEFQLQERWVGEHATPIDLLSHRVGIAGFNFLWSQGGNGNHLDKKELVKSLGSFPQVQNFRQGFLYHNLLYGLVSEIVERTTDQTYGTFITEHIFKPLDMHRSSIKMDGPTPDNYAKAYMPMDDGSFVSIDRPVTRDGTIQASAGGIRSCVKDLLSFYNAILTSRNLEQSALSSTSETKKATIKNASLLTAGHTFLTNSSLHERSAALGLLRVQLPNTFGDIGPNFGLINPMPTIGRGDPSRLVLWHQGSYPGYLSSAMLVPEEDLIIVVLTNSLALNDAADWIGQLLLEHALDTRYKNDFVALAQQSRDAYIHSFASAESELEAGRAVNPDVKSAQAYTGDYFNTLGNWYIRVFVNEADSGLYMCIQGEDWDIYPLHPYATDTFTWYTTREDQARRGRWPIQAGDYFKFTFVPNAEGEVTQLQWNMDGSVPAGTFYKKASSSDLSGGIEQKPLAAA